VTVRLETDDDSAVIRIIDRGIGIPENLVEDVFFEFVRAPNAKQHAAEGTGLGLAIVRDVIEAHGGRTYVETGADEGTTFRVDLPLRHQPEEASGPLPASNDPGYHADTPRGRNDPV
jgi:signal transduction histidine kinase